MPTYKTKNGQDYILPGIGRTVDGQITTQAKIENPNFVVVSETTPAPAVPAAANVPAGPDVGAVPPAAAPPSKAEVA